MCGIKTKRLKQLFRKAKSISLAAIPLLASLFASLASPPLATSGQQCRPLHCQFVGFFACQLGTTGCSGCNANECVWNCGGTTVIIQGNCCICT